MNTSNELLNMKWDSSIILYANFRSVLFCLVALVYQTTIRYMLEYNNASMAIGMPGCRCCGKLSYEAFFSGTVVCVLTSASIQPFPLIKLFQIRLSALFNCHLAVKIGQIAMVFFHRNIAFKFDSVKQLFILNCPPKWMFERFVLCF